MSDTMKIEDYLAQGGVLSSPENAAGFADMINAGPGIKERIAASKIVLEKTDNADKVLKIMGDFGANRAKYASHHPWTARLPRDADIGATRVDADMRLSVFNYPLQGWQDSVVMNLLMGRAVVVQLQEFSRVNYQPLAEAFRTILPIETRHAELAAEGLERLQETGADKNSLQESVTYWWPRVSASFGSSTSERTANLRAFGLRHQENSDLRQSWVESVTADLGNLGLTAPDAG